jgi:hypothetical protein
MAMMDSSDRRDMLPDWSRELQLLCASVVSLGSLSL